jgi:hypothetical protein
MRTSPELTRDCVGLCVYRDCEKFIISEMVTDSADAAHRVNSFGLFEKLALLKAHTFTSRLKSARSEKRKV